MRDAETTEQIRECLASIRAQGLDPAAYNTRISADDLVDLRRALGYERWMVQGESYGSRLAQELMRIDGDAIHSVTLIAPVLPGPANVLEAPLIHQRALERLFAACAADTACHAAFPDPAADYFATYEALSREPLRIPPVGSDGPPILLTAARYRASIRNLLESPERLTRIPIILNESRRGDPLRAARAILPGPSARPPENASASRRAPGPPSVALTNFILCYDHSFDGLKEAYESVNQIVHPALRRQQTEFECDIWLSQPPVPSHHLPIFSSIPTLILAGEFDPATPPDHARRIASTLTRAYVYELPGMSHGVRHACTAQLIQQFRRDPQRAPDASCIAQMLRPTFATRW